MKGRHTAGGRPRPKASETTNPALPEDVRYGDGEDGPGVHEDDAGPGGFPKKLALYAGLALCVAFIAWVAWGFIQFDHDIDNPREGGFSGWQCDAGRDCGS